MVNQRRVGLKQCGFETPPNFEIWDNLSWEHVTFGLLDLWHGELTVERTLILLDSLFRGFYWTNGCGKWRLLLLAEKMHEQKCQDCISNFWTPAEKTLTCWHLNLAKSNSKYPSNKFMMHERIINSMFCPMPFVSSHLSNPETIADLRTKRKAKIAWSSRAQRRRFQQFTAKLGTSRGW